MKTDEKEILIIEEGLEAEDIANDMGCCKTGPAPPL